jgi:hypothetical protein
LLAAVIHGNGKVGNLLGMRFIRLWKAATAHVRIANGFTEKSNETM